MPKFTFVCQRCQTTRQLIADVSAKPVCEQCGQELHRKLPTLNGPSEVRETVSHETNTKFKQDQVALIKERNTEYYWKHVVPKLANDPKYSLETKLENGWISIDDKGQVHIHTKPPGRR